MFVIKKEQLQDEFNLVLLTLKNINFLQDNISKKQLECDKKQNELNLQIQKLEKQKEIIKLKQATMSETQRAIDLKNKDIFEKDKIINAKNSDMNNTSNQINSKNLSSIETQIRATENNIKLQEDSLMFNEKKKELHKNYEENITIYEEIKEVVVEKSSSGRLTQCAACDNLCHNPCYIGSGDDLSSCCAFTNKVCTECHHHVDRHRHSETYYKTITKSVPRIIMRTNEAQKNLYQEALRNIQSITQDISNLRIKVVELKQQQATINIEIKNLTQQHQSIQEYQKKEKKEKDIFVNEKLNLENKKVEIQREMQKLQQEMESLDNQKLIFENEIGNIKLDSEHFSEELKKSSIQKSESQKKLAKLQDELEKIAMVGYDDSFIGFMKFMIEQVKKRF